MSINMPPGNGKLVIRAAGGGGGGGSSNLVGTFASRPASGTTGQIYLPTDEGGSAVWDGSEWRPMLGQYLGKRADLASFSWINQGGSTAAQVGDGIKMDLSGVSGTQIHGLQKSGSSYVIANANMVGTPGSVQVAGIFMLESSSGLIASLNLVSAGGSGFISTGKWSGPTSRSYYNDIRSETWSVPLFMKISVSGRDANCYVSTSPNGPFLLLESFSSFFNVTADQIGIFVNNENSTETLAVFNHFDGA